MNPEEGNPMPCERILKVWHHIILFLGVSQLPFTAKDRDISWFPTLRETSSTHPNPLHACRSLPPDPWNSPSLMGVCSSTYKAKLHSDNLSVFLHKMPYSKKHSLHYMCCPVCITLFHLFGATCNFLYLRQTCEQIKKPVQFLFFCCSKSIIFDLMV